MWTGLIRKVSPATFSIPELQYACGIEVGINSAYKIQISDIEAAINACCQGYRCQQLISISKAITARAWDASSTPITHDACDDGWLLGHKDVLTATLMKDAWCQINKENNNHLNEKRMCYFQKTIFSKSCLREPFLNITTTFSEHYIKLLIKMTGSSIESSQASQHIRLPASQKGMTLLSPQISASAGLRLVPKKLLYSLTSDNQDWNFKWV